MTKEFAEILTDEDLLNEFVNVYGQSVFCPESGLLKWDVEVLKAEILRRMKKN